MKYLTPRLPEKEIELCLELFDKKEAKKRILEYIEGVFVDAENQLKNSIDANTVLRRNDTGLTKEEVFSEITSPLKWYLGHYSQSYASQIVQRFEDGRLSEKTIDKLFNYFGYSVSTPKQWVKKTDR